MREGARRVDAESKIDELVFRNGQNLKAFSTLLFVIRLHFFACRLLSPSRARILLRLAGGGRANLNAPHKIEAPEVRASGNFRAARSNCVGSRPRAAAFFRQDARAFWPPSLSRSSSARAARAWHPKTHILRAWRVVVPSCACGPLALGNYARRRCRA